MLWMQHDPQAKRGTLPRHIQVRRGTMDDEYAAFEVMRKTMGHEMVWTHHLAARRHLQNTQGASFWVAEEKHRFGSSRIIGYARSVARDCVWSLTEFFVLPGHHRQGIGGALLARCQEEGERYGADTRFILASQHPGADSLYIRKLGCYPRIPMMMLVGALSKLRVLEPDAPPIVEAALPFVVPEVTRQAANYVGETLRAEPIVLTSETQATLDRLDRQIVGFARAPEHAFWTSEMGGTGGAARLFRRIRRYPDGTVVTGEITGYAYLGPYSSGPALALDPNDLPRMLTHVTALSRASSHSESEFDLTQPLEQYWAVAGTNEVMLRWLLECGWQIVFHYLFMSSRPLGSFDRYVGYNPLYFL